MCVAIALVGSFATQIVQASKVEDNCIDIGKVTKIVEASTLKNLLHATMINKDGQTTLVAERSVVATENDSISSIDTPTFFYSDVKAEINNKIQNLRIKSLKVNDTVQMCKNNTVKVKPG